MGIEHRRLGRHGTLVSNLALGTVNFGTNASEQESFAILDRALELGINLIDTADVYGYEHGYGLVEELLGRWLAQGGGRRDAVVLATKVYSAFLREGMRPEPNRESRGIGAVKIRRQVEGSLRRLQTDTIDLYQMHHIDPACPWDEAWQAFDTLVQQGKVTYIGSSNFGGWHIATACQEAARRNRLGLVSEQSRYNLATREPELEVIPACRHYGLGLLPYSPVEGGALAGVLGQPEGRRRYSAYAQRAVTRYGERLQQYEDYCAELGVAPAEMALAWLLHNPAVTAPIIGPRTLEQLESSVRATELTLDEATLARLDEIWPGPGGEAPAAYAW